MDIERILELTNQYKELDQRVQRIKSNLHLYNSNKHEYDLLITFEACSRSYNNIYFRYIISDEDMIALITKKKEMLEAELEKIKTELEGKGVDTGTCNEDME